jgi:hypothetical protein
MSIENKNSLARIKLWLDIPYYVNLVGSEAVLDDIIISCGFCENDLIVRYNKARSIEEALNCSVYSEIEDTENKTEYIKLPNTKGVTSRIVTRYIYNKAIDRSVVLERAIINRKNKELATYGYALYSSDHIDKLFFVQFDENYSLYIPIKAFLEDDYKTINESINKGIRNIADCTKALDGDEKLMKALYTKITKSDLYLKILKLKKNDV